MNRAELLLLMRAEADARQQRIANVHTKVACPECGSPAGERCRRIGRHFSRGQVLKHSHTQRLRAAGITLR